MTKHKTLTQRNYNGPTANTKNTSGNFPGGRWNIFKHLIEQRVEDGKVVNRYQWRAHIALHDGTKYWKGDSDRRIMELWLKDKIIELSDHTKIIYTETPKKN